MKRKALSLIETLITIFIFSLVMTFLYKSLEVSKQNLQFTNESISVISRNFKFDEIIYKDLLLKKTEPITNNTSNNSFVYFTSDNNYHYPYSKYISYIIIDDDLYRIESNSSIALLSVNNLDLVSKNFYLDKILDNVKHFNLEIDVFGNYLLLVEFSNGKFITKRFVL